MDIQKEKKQFINEFMAYGGKGVIIENYSDNGEKIEDYFERKLNEAKNAEYKKLFWKFYVIKS